MNDYTRSELDALAEALIAFQDEMPTVPKTKSANIPGKNGSPGYTYSYADLADVTAAAVPLLTKHDLAFSCLPRDTGKGYELVGTLLHTSGQSITGALPIHGNDPRALGSALTYARRYLLGCMTGIVTDDDDDAGQAQTSSRTRQWDGPSTADLLNQIDADAQRAGVTYEQALAKFIAAKGITLDQVDALDPWHVTALAEAVRKRADEVTAEQAAAGTDPDQPA